MYGTAGDLSPIDKLSTRGDSDNMGPCGFGYYDERILEDYIFLTDVKSAYGFA